MKCAKLRATKQGCSNSRRQSWIQISVSPYLELHGTAPTPCIPGHSETQDWRDLHRIVFNMTQCLLTPAIFFLIVTGTRNVMWNVMCGKILLGISIWIQCKMPALLTSIQPDKRRCSHNSLSDICWEYITIKVELVICLQIDIFSSRCK